MSEFGYKITNYQAGSIIEHNNGVREMYDKKDAMLTNSLFLDFLENNGLNVWKEKSTRDVICIEFDYGSRSYEEDVKKLQKSKEKTLASENYTEEQKEEIAQRYDELIERANANKDKYVKLSAQDIRILFYTKGVDIKYKIYSRKKDAPPQYEVIHYKMLYRTPGKAKKGSCMFIREELYDIARDYLYMGIQLPEKNAPIVEIGAYSSLVTSTIVDKINISPEDILVIKDVDSYFNTKAISIETNEKNQCIAVHKDDYQVKNTLFDGQALIDSSIFPDWADGYILLRHHMCKMAAFCSNIQMFFKDYYGDNYSSAVVKDMFGKEHYAKDIKLITTENAMKWMKMPNVDYDYWANKVHENGDMFGIVKTAHPSKYGDVQRMSYQMVNALDISSMNHVTQRSVDYIESLKFDDEVFLQFLRDRSNFSNDFDVLLALVEQNRDFMNSDYFRDRRHRITTAYLLNVKTGKVIQNADNLTIVGSPYAMLLHAVGEDVEKDNTLVPEDGAIQCYTERFDDGEYLAEFRSPFNAKHGMGYMHNVLSPTIKKYFKLGKLCIAVNMIHTVFQPRNNGSDQDFS